MFLLKLFLVSVLMIGTLYADKTSWSSKTKTIDQDESKQIIEAYTKGKTLPLYLTFADDKAPVKGLGIEENILVFGMGLSYGATQERVSNKNGSNSDSYTTSSLTLMLGKDFTLWHEKYHQLSRIYLTYNYNFLSTDLTYSAFSFGFKESMEYFTFYEGDGFYMYPTLAIELGQSYIERDKLSIRGFTTAAAGGIVYQRGNFEYYLNVTSTTIDWNHPVDGIKDKAHTLGLSFGLNYKLMYGSY